MTTVLIAARGRFPFCSAIIRAEPAGEAAGAPGALVPRPRGNIAMDFATADEVRMAAAAGAPRRPGREIVARKRLVRRIWQTAERQVAEIENRLAGLRDDPQALERDAKILAIVTRTVRDIVALDQEANSLPHKNRTDEARAEPPAKSLEAFRTELALRLDQLRRERPGEGTD